MAVVFTVTGVELNPDDVTVALGLFPDRSWLVGEQYEALGRKFDGVYEKSGWKKFAPQEMRENLADDFGYWLPFIEEKKDALAALHSAGHCVSIDVLVQSDAYEFEPEELRLLADACVVFTFRSWEGPDDTPPNQQ